MELSADLRAFVFACVDGVEQMEMLALLHDRATASSTQEVARELGLAPAAARHHLETLTARGLLRVEVGAEARYGYDPRTPALRGFADELVRVYGTSRMAVLHVIAQNAKGSLKSFADAFKLRGPG